MAQRQGMNSGLTAELIVDHQHGELCTAAAPIVRASGLRPGSEAKLLVTCRDDNGRLWSSSNLYLVTDEGTFDTSREAAMGDSYYGVVPEGPLTSMVCQDGPGHDFAYQESDRLDYRFVILDGEVEVWSAEISRRWKLESPPAPRVLVHYYSDELNRAEVCLANHGVMLANLGVGAPQPGSDAHLEGLPTFIVASGKASGKALEAAIRTPGLQGVILFSGGGLRFDPIRPAGAESSEPELDFIPLDHASLRPRAAGVVATRDLYAQAVAVREVRERGRIEVEKIACPLYLFSGSDDQVWPSAAFSELVAQRRKIAGCVHPTSHQTFEGVGHDLGPSLGLPSLPTSERTVGHADTGFRLLLGGKMGRTGRARRECWDSLLTILGV